MSESDKPKDALWLLRAVHHRVDGEMRGKYGGPRRTAFARLVAVTVVVLFAGSILWSAFVALWPTILVIVVVVVGVKLLRRLLRR